MLLVVMEFDNEEDSVPQEKNQIVRGNLQKKSLVICLNVTFGVSGELGVTVLPVVGVENNKDPGTVEMGEIVLDLQKSRRPVLMWIALIGVPGAVGMTVLPVVDKGFRRE